MLIDISEDNFWSIETRISYPLAGAWVDFFINEFGIDVFWNVYSHSSKYIKKIEKETGKMIGYIDEKFFEWVLTD